jgi:Bacterial Ig-like domain
MLKRQLHGKPRSAAFRAVKSVLLPVAASILLAACGGGGEEGGPGGNETPAPQTFTVGGTVSGLAGSGLVLQNNSGDDLAISANGNFTFSGRLASGAAYDVSIKTQPANPHQLCVVANGSGTVAAANVTNLAVTCNVVPSAFTIGGTVTGLTGSVVLQNNGADDLVIGSNGPFVFAAAMANGAAYSVSVKTQPGSPPQVCSVSNASGTVGGTHVTDVGVTCVKILAVTGTTPADNATGVARHPTIAIEFSAAIDPATVHDASITLASRSGSKKLTFATSGRQVTVTPVGNLLPVAQYTLAITPAVRGAAGEVLASTVTRTFKVRDGQWGTPALVQSATSGGLYAQVGFDSSGNAIAVWSQGDGTNLKIAANRYVAGSGWGTASVVMPDGNQARALKLAVDVNGNAFAVWEDYLGAGDSRVLAARYSAGAGWSPELLLGANASASGPQVATDPMGNAIAVWEEFDGAARSVWTKRYVVGAGWDAGALLAMGSGTTSADFMSPQIALDRQGNAVATWRQKAGLFHDGWARHYVIGSGWGLPISIESEQSSVNIVQIALDPNGNAFAVWAQGTANFGHSSIWSNRYLAGSEWGQPTLLEQNDIAPGQAPALAVDAAGNAIVVWQHSDLSRTETDIWANRHVAGTGWTGADLIEKQNLGNANSAQVATDPSGNAIAVWKQSDGTRTNIWANRYIAGESWGLAQLLELEDGGALDPHVAVDADGNAFAIWSQSVGTGIHVFVNRFE